MCTGVIEVLQVQSYHGNSIVTAVDLHSPNIFRPPIWPPSPWFFAEKINNAKPLLGTADLDSMTKRGILLQLSVVPFEPEAGS